MTDDSKPDPVSTGLAPPDVIRDPRKVLCKYFCCAGFLAFQVVSKKKVLIYVNNSPIKVVLEGCSKVSR